jgi:hypothetical protein
VNTDKTVTTSVSFSDPDLLLRGKARAKGLRMSFSNYVARLLEADLDKGGALIVKEKPPKEDDGELPGGGLKYPEYAAQVLGMNDGPSSGSAAEGGGAVGGGGTPREPGRPGPQPSGGRPGVRKPPGKGRRGGGGAGAGGGFGS